MAREDVHERGLPGTRGTHDGCERTWSHPAVHTIGDHLFSFFCRHRERNVFPLQRDCMRDARLKKHFGRPAKALQLDKTAPTVLDERRSPDIPTGAQTLGRSLILHRRLCKDTPEGVPLKRNIGGVAT